MRAVFADTGYWIALIHPRDNLRPRALAASDQLSGVKIVTSEMILVEVLNSFSSSEHLRKAAADAVMAISKDPTVEVVPQTRQLFRDALTLYAERADKEWSLTDCASFVIMKRMGIAQALTDDHHFVQNGFEALLKT
jgi:predicted nucleic acid-binding protein